MIPEDGDINRKDWLYAATKEPSFNLLKEPEEEYSVTDGKPCNDER
jgi:hypothetical protein